MDKMFGLNGIAGLLIAVVLLLSIVGFLGFKAVTTQQTSIEKPYHVKDLNKVKMISSENALHQIKNK